MPRLFVTARSGEVVEIRGESGSSLMEILHDNDLDIAAICGGLCSCGTCHVYIAPEWLNKLPGRPQLELELLRELEYYKETNSRLSCQIEFNDDLDGLSLTVAPHE